MSKQICPFLSAHTPRARWTIPKSGGYGAPRWMREGEVEKERLVKVRKGKDESVATRQSVDDPDTS